MLSKISFGYKMNPDCMTVILRKNGLEKGTKKIEALKNEGNDNLEISSGCGDYCGNMTIGIPKYNIYNEGYINNSDLDVEKVKKTEKNIIDKILINFAEKGELEARYKKLMEDFPHLADYIEMYATNPYLSDINSENQKKSKIFRFLKNL